jgi:hypothetical protein
LIGGFRAVRDDAWISAMWREVGGGGWAENPPQAR